MAHTSVTHMLSAGFIWKKKMGNGLKPTLARPKGHKQPRIPAIPHPYMQLLKWEQFIPFTFPGDFFRLWKEKNNKSSEWQAVRILKTTHKIPFRLSWPLPLIFTHHATQHCHQLSNHTSIEWLLRIQIWALLVGIQKFVQDSETQLSS